MAYTDIASVYQDVLGRAPDAGGQQFYQNMMNQGTSLEHIANVLRNSPEYASLAFKAPQYSGQTMSAGDAMGAGLGAAYVAMQNMADQSWRYPQYQAYQAPVQMGYAQYQAPQYQTLSGGDYDALEAALYKGGATAADAQYRQGQTDIANVMGGRGLYGSSLMGVQMQNLTQQAADTKAKLAAEAAQSRYALQAAELGRMNQLSQGDAERYNDYLQQKLAWDYAQANMPVQYQNLEADRRLQHELDTQNYRQNMINNLFNMGTGLAGGSAGTVNQNAQLAAQKRQSDSLARQQMWSGVASGLLAGFTPSASGDTAFGKMYDALTGWF